MVMALYTRDPHRCCPGCGERGCLDYLEVPEHTRRYTNADGEECTEHFGEAKDFKCRDCDAEFTLTRDIEDAT